MAGGQQDARVLKAGEGVLIIDVGGRLYVLLVITSRQGHQFMLYLDVPHPLTVKPKSKFFLKVFKFKITAGVDNQTITFGKPPHHLIIKYMALE